MSSRRIRGYKGYSRPSRFMGRRGSSTYSTRKLIMVTVLVLGGVFLMTWFLSQAKGAL